MRKLTEGAGFPGIAKEGFPPVMGAAIDRQVLYLNTGERTLPWEYNGWKRESMSWKTGCYIHAGLSGWQIDLDGQDIEAFLASLCTNSFQKFPVGSMKHAVMCTEEGLVASHAILQRNGAQQFRLFAAGYPWLEYQASKSTLRINVRRTGGFLFQVAGPNSIHTLEKATGESLRDIEFLRFRPATIDGELVEIGRIGMSGNLAYEVRGALDKGPLVFDAVVKAGADFGIERLGFKTYFVNHVEGGFPQTGWTFFTAAIADPAFHAFSRRPEPRLTGSSDPRNLASRFRNPFEIGWGKTVRFDHDFIGRAALEALKQTNRRVPATLRWNPDDVQEVNGSLLRKGEEYKTIDFPVSETWQHGFFAHADTIVASDGREIGISSGTIYSYYFREVISMATIDAEFAHDGQEVVVRWGDFGGRIKEVRATVGRFPYLAEGRNDQVVASNID